MDLQAACQAASAEAARIDAKIQAKLVKLARKHGMTEADGIKLAKVVKRAAGRTKRLDLGAATHACCSTGHSVGRRSKRGASG